MWNERFSQCDEVYSVVLGTDGTTLYLPAELHAGAVKMAVFGYDTESDTTVRATTVPVTLNIRESGFEGDDPPIPPTPDLYTQLLKRIEDAEHGLDDKSAYEIAVEHGYVGTEEEWLESLKGKDGITPDMSEYPKTTEVQNIVETVIQPVAEESHTHPNKETLDRLTPELLQELDGLQQFEDATNYDIHDIREALLPISSAAHSHANKAVIDSITQEMLDDLSSISTVVGQAHWHHNLTTLNSITAAYQYTHVDVRTNGKWYGDEVHGNSSVTDDFYKYFGGEDMKGIDVSVHNGDIDWQKVKADGIEFAILCAGYGKLAVQKDKKFDDNYAGAKAAGIPVGAYWYSYAMDEDEARLEADVFLSVIKGKQFEFPVYFNLEEKKQFDLGKEKVSAIMRAFLERVKSAGYFTGLYGSASSLTTHTADDIKSRYTIWLAHWVNQTNYSGTYAVWQYSEKSKVAGISGKTVQATRK